MINSGTEAWNKKIIHPSEKSQHVPLVDNKRTLMTLQEGANTSAEGGSNNSVERGESCIWSDVPEQRGTMSNGETATTSDRHSVPA